MKEKAKKIISHPLFSGSAVMILGTNFANILNYIYHLVMGRLLGPAAYGELAALFSLVGILGVLTIALNLVIVKYISSAPTENEVKRLTVWFTKKTLFLAIVILVIISIAAPLIAGFLKLGSFWLVVLVALMSAFSLLSAANKAVLQGLLRFNQTVEVILLENGAKLILGVALVYLGFMIGGAMIGLVTAGALSWVLSRNFLNRYIGKETASPPIKSILRYFLPVLVQAVAVTSIYSMDLILVKHFFKPHEAGIYAATSTLGKIIYFGASPIGLVMFPLVSKRIARGQSYRKIFLASLVATATMAFGVVGIFKFFPLFAIKNLFGNSYMEAEGLLVGFGIFMVFFTLSVLLTNFYLSLKKTKAVILPMLAAIAQVWGIWVFHGSLNSVIEVSIIVSGILFLSLLMYSLFDRKTLA